LGQRRIEAQKVRIYWETGDLIHAQIKKNRNRAEYGAEVIRRLAEDLKVEDSTLHRCVRFAQTYPRSRIVGGRPQFSWTHYRKLIAISDDRKRSLLEESIARNNWSADELGARIKVIKKTDSPAVEVSPAAKQKLLTPLRGQLYTYRMVQRPTLGSKEESRQLLLDCGFGFFRDLDERVQARFSVGAIVESRPREDSYGIYETTRTEKDLYTYKAFIERVIDGDTLKVRIDLGFDCWMRGTLRLRGIDCPEAGTKEGGAARAFVQSHLKEASLIILRSSRSDKYARYLADVFIPAGEESDPATDLFLNNILLQEGLAGRMD